MDKKKFFIGLGVFISFSTVIGLAISLNDYRKRIADDLSASAEIFDVILDELKRMPEAGGNFDMQGCLIGVICRRASLKEVRDGAGINNNDIILEMVRSTPTDTPVTFHINSLIRSIGNYDHIAERYRDRLDKFGFSLYHLEHDSCAVWVEAIKKILNQRRCWASNLMTR